MGDIGGKRVSNGVMGPSQLTTKSTSLDLTSCPGFNSNASIAFCALFCSSLFSRRRSSATTASSSLSEGGQFLPNSRGREGKGLSIPYPRDKTDF